MLKVNNPQVQNSSLLEIAPGERSYIEFIADGKGDFTIANGNLHDK